MKAREALFSIACDDMPTSAREVTEAIRAADLELADLLRAHAVSRRSMRGEVWFDTVLEVAGVIASLPLVEAP